MSYAQKIKIVVCDANGIFERHLIVDLSCRVCSDLNVTDIEIQPERNVRYFQKMLWIL